MAFDKVLKEAGEFGFFQKVYICGYVHVSVLLMATAFWSQVYVLLVPPHRCRINYEDNVWSQKSTANFSMTSSSCALDISNSQSGNISECPYGWIYDYTHMYPSFPSEHNWVCHDSWRVYTVHSFYWLGSVAGFVIFGSLSDRIGRKWSFMGCICMLMLGDIGSFLANSFATFLIGRFVSAIGEANLGTCCFVFAIEYTGPKYRVIVLAVSSLTFTFSCIVLPFIVYGLADWHYILSFAWGVSVLSLMVTSIIPESASWLLTRGRVEDAAKCIHQVAKVNGKAMSLHRIKDLLLEKEEPKESSLVEKSENDENFKQMPFMEAMKSLFRTPNMRKKTILAIILTMISAMCYVGNSLETTNLPLPFPLSYAVGGMAEVPANIICILALDRIGRRWANVFFFILGGVLGIIAGGFVRNSLAIIILVTLMRMCNAANFQISFTHSSEVFPTVVRGRGVSLTRIFGGLASAVSPFIFSLSERGKLLPVLVFGVLCIIGGVLTFFVSETAGQHLPHTLEDGENFGKEQSCFYCPFSQRKKSGSQQNLEISAIDSKIKRLSVDNARETDNVQSHNLHI